MSEGGVSVLYEADTGQLCFSVSLDLENVGVYVEFACRACRAWRLSQPCFPFSKWLLQSSAFMGQFLFQGQAPLGLANPSSGGDRREVGVQVSC